VEVVRPLGITFSLIPHCLDLILMDIELLQHSESRGIQISKKNPDPSGKPLTLLKGQGLLRVIESVP
jgi:hypothetical protein